MLDKDKTNKKRLHKRHCHPAGFGVRCDTEDGFNVFGECHYFHYSGSYFVMLKRSTSETTRNLCAISTCSKFKSGNRHWFLFDRLNHVPLRQGKAVDPLRFHPNHSFILKKSRSFSKRLNEKSWLIRANRFPYFRQPKWRQQVTNKCCTQSFLPLFKVASHHLTISKRVRLMIRIRSLRSGNELLERQSKSNQRLRLARRIGQVFPSLILLTMLLENKRLPLH